MYTRHNALRNDRIERYQNMYANQVIELRDQREEKRKEEERKEKAKQEHIRLQQLKTGERFEYKLSSYETLIGNIWSPNDLMMDLSLSDDCTDEYDHCCHTHSLSKSELRNLIDQLTKVHDHMTDEEPKDSD